MVLTLSIWAFLRLVAKDFSRAFASSSGEATPNKEAEDPWVPAVHMLFIEGVVASNLGDGVGFLSSRRAWRRRLPSRRSSVV